MFYTVLHWILFLGTLIEVICLYAAWGDDLQQSITIIVGALFMGCLTVLLGIILNKMRIIFKNTSNADINRASFCTAFLLLLFMFVTQVVYFFIWKRSKYAMIAVMLARNGFTLMTQSVVWSITLKYGRGV